MYTRRVQESDDEYVKRINIVRVIFSKSSIWQEDESLTYSEDYYKCVSKQKENEDTKTYYSRLTQRLEGESDECYVQRLSSIEKLLPNLSLWCEETYTYLTKTYYLLRYTKTETEETSSYYLRLFKQQTGETTESYVKRIKIISTLFSELTIWENLEEIEITRTYYEYLFKQKNGESWDKYYNRIMYQGLFESPEHYVKRISFIQKLYPGLDLWTNKKYLIYTAKYFKLLYKRLANEKDEQYYARILQRSSDESDEYYVKRISIIETLFKNLSFLFNNASYLKYTREYYEILYGQRNKETYQKYLARVFKQGAKEGNVEFVDRMKLLYAMYPNLAIWHNPKEVRYTRRYYLDLYKRNRGESEDDYYRRLMYQGLFESDDHYTQRIQVVQAILPKLDLWTEVKYLPYTAKYYRFLYQQKDGESETAFLKNVFKRKSQESKDNYVKRLDLLKKVLHVELESIFDNLETLEWTKEYYTINYGQKQGESVDDFVARTFKHDADESDSEYVTRIKIVMALFPELEIWNDKEQLECTKHFYELLYERQPDQSEQDYYQAIFGKGKNESPEDYFKRIQIFQLIHPESTIWDNPEYLIYTKKFYEMQYTKPKDKTEEDFIKSIFQRTAFETKTHYLNRLTTFFLVDSQNSIWSDSKYVKYTKPYFNVLFAQKPDESVSSWANRILKQYTEENEEEYASRLKIVQAALGEKMWKKITAAKSGVEKIISHTGVTYINDDVSKSKVMAK